MGNFLPGDPAGIDAVAAALDSESPGLDTVEGELLVITLPSWTATGSDLARNTIHHWAAGMTGAASSYGSCAVALSAFAASLRAGNARVAAAEAVVQSCLPIVTPADAIAYARAVAELRQTEDEVTTQYWIDVTTCAEAIIGATTGASGHGGGGPYANDTLTSVDGQGLLDDLVSLNGQVDLSDAALNPDLVAQGNAGDCWFLSSLMSLASTAWGRDAIRAGLRWDSDKGGYWVRLYKDGKPHEYFVNAIYADGAGSGDNLSWPHEASWVSIYEAAMVQAQGKGDDTKGGFGADGFEAITGQKAVHAGADPATLRKALQDGAYATAGSDKKTWIFGHDAGTVNAQVQDASGAWHTESVDLVDGHEYDVVRVDGSNNVYLRNPWGESNSSDGGGIIRLTAEQFKDNFDETSYFKPSK
ncbi:MAG: hypothetical protein LBM66_07155 [Bifidobacteriaceae bacterium]|jgi:hypothetical protein|nr:hypothetical protein [Bifidobacteriaceae bacterium]